MPPQTISSEWHLEHAWGASEHDVPNAMQWDVITDDTHEATFVHGGKGSGKTHVEAEWLWDAMVVRNPGCNHGAVGLTMPMMLMPDSLIPAIRSAMARTAWVTPEGVRHPWQEDIDWYERRTSPREIALPHFGSTLTMISAGDKMLRAATFRDMAFDEVGLWAEADFAAGIGRLRGGDKQRLLGGTTPEKSCPWFVEFVRKFCYDEPQPGWRAIQASTRNAHWLGEGYVRRLQLVYSAEAQRAYIDGELLIAGSGGVYTKWSDRWVWKPGDPRPEPAPRGPEPLRISPDWGGPHTAIIFAQVEAADTDVGARRNVFAELDLGPNATAKDYGEAAGNMIVASGWHVGREVIVTGDPQGATTRLGVSTTRLGELLAALRSKGVNARHRPLPSSPLVGDRIEAVNNSLEKGRILVHHRCKRLIKDRREVKWNRSGSELDKGQGQDQTHYSDADDYDILTVWGVPKAGDFRVVRNERAPIWPHERVAPDDDIRARFRR